jgi:N-acetylneuraminic acid mutarotase
MDMKKLAKIVLAILIFSWSEKAMAQWTALQAMAGVSRSFSTAFAIDSKIYVVGGSNSNGTLNDLWEYDIASNNWTQKADPPFGYRGGAATFVLGSNGYLCTGNNGSAYMDDLWKYEPLTDTWMQLANFPGQARDEAVAFVIGNKAYVGTGQQFVITPNNSFTVVYSDFYEYDANANTWTAKADIPGTGRAYAAGVAVGNKAYVGLGGNNDQTLSYSDFYEYDAVADSWTAIASMPGNGKADVGIFSSGGYIYVIGGVNFPQFSISSIIRKYDLVANTWSTSAAYPGGPIAGLLCVNVNDTIYAGTGGDALQVAQNDWYRFTPLINGIVESGKEQLNVFPNPFESQVTLTISNWKEASQVQLFDKMGRLVLTMPYEEAMGLNLDYLSNGIYQLRVINKSGLQVGSQKLLKLK